MAESGIYEVELWYACPEGDLGTNIELSVKGGILVTKITEANEPQLVGMNDDRSPRSESYVKAFKPMNMGKIMLAKSKGELKLQAQEIIGEQAMDFRLIMLRRKDVETN